MLAEYTYERRFADESEPVTPLLPGDVFDLTSHTGVIRSNFALTDTITLGAGYSLRGGDVVSTTRRNLSIFQASKAVARDPAFGSDFFAYKIDALVHTLGAGVSYAVTRSASLNLSYEYQIGIAHDGIDYHNNVVRLGILYSY